MDRKLFAFLKDRKIFTSGGHKTLREYLSAQEVKSENTSREETFNKKEALKIKRANPNN